MKLTDDLRRALLLHSKETMSTITTTLNLTDEDVIMIHEVEMGRQMR